MDLRFVAQPILVGHYEQDPIAGPQGLIDRELLDGDLSERHSLGLYAGPLRHRDGGAARAQRGRTPRAAACAARWSPAWAPTTAR